MKLLAVKVVKHLVPTRRLVLPETVVVTVVQGKVLVLALVVMPETVEMGVPALVMPEPAVQVVLEVPLCKIQQNLHPAAAVELVS